MEFSMDTGVYVCQQLVNDFDVLLVKVGNELCLEYSMTMMRNYLAFYEIYVQSFVELSGKVCYEVQWPETRVFQLDVMGQKSRVYTDSKKVVFSKPPFPSLRIRFKLVSRKDPSTKPRYSPKSTTFRLVTQKYLFKKYNKTKYKHTLRNKKHGSFLYEIKPLKSPLLPVFVNPPDEDFMIKCKIINVYPRKGSIYGGDYINIYFNMYVNSPSHHLPYFSPRLPNVLIYFGSKQAYPVQVRPNRPDYSPELISLYPKEWTRCRKEAMYVYRCITPHLGKNQVTDITMKFTLGKTFVNVKLASLSKCYIFTDEPITPPQVKKQMKEFYESEHRKLQKTHISKNQRTKMNEMMKKKNSVTAPKSMSKLANISTKKPRTAPSVPRVGRKKLQRRKYSGANSPPSPILLRNPNSMNRVRRKNRRAKMEKLSAMKIFKLSKSLDTSPTDFKQHRDQQQTRVRSNDGTPLSMSPGTDMSDFSGSPGSPGSDYDSEVDESFENFLSLQSRQTLSFVFDETLIHTFYKELMYCARLWDEAQKFKRDEMGIGMGEKNVANNSKKMKGVKNKESKKVVVEEEEEEDSLSFSISSDKDKVSTSSKSGKGKKLPARAKRMINVKNVNKKSEEKKVEEDRYVLSREDVEMVANSDYTFHELLSQVYRKYFNVIDIYGYNILHHLFLYGEIALLSEVLSENSDHPHFYYFLTALDNFGNSIFHCCSFSMYYKSNEVLKKQVIPQLIPDDEKSEHYFSSFFKNLANCHGHTASDISFQKNVYAVLGDRPVALHIGSFLTKRDQMTYSRAFRYFHVLRDFRVTPLSEFKREIRLDERNLLPIKEWELLDMQFVYPIGVGNFTRVYLTKIRHKIDPDYPQYYACKVIPKCETLRLKQVEHIVNEKVNLEICRGGPFVNYLYRTLQDNKNVYMLLDFVQGNELFYHLRYYGKFTNEAARFYAAEMTLAFEYLHKRDIIYRDLKPENIMLDSEGHAKLIDFGFSKKVKSGDRTYSLVGTPDYLAPEVIQNQGHTKAVDWWTLGILIFEMLVGYPPFFSNSEDVLDTYTNILRGEIRFPRNVHRDAMDVITKLLNPDQSRRMGLYGMKKHRWFKKFNWRACKKRRMKPPITVVVTSKKDLRYFVSGFCRARASKPKTIRQFQLSKEQQDLFKDF